MSALFEGVAAGERAKAAAELMGHASRITSEPPAWWGNLPGEDFLLELRVPPGAAVRALAAVAAAGEAGGVPVHVRGAIASSVLHLAGSPATPCRAVARDLRVGRVSRVARAARELAWCRRLPRAPPRGSTAGGPSGPPRSCCG